MLIRQFASLLGGMLLTALLGSAATAQLHAVPTHLPPRLNGVAPGATGSLQLYRDPRTMGYFQPVQVSSAPGVRVAFAASGDFLPPQRNPVAAGLLIGQVYRLRVTNIPLLEGYEVFPTIEVVDRLYPPEGSAGTFPIPVEITAEELQQAYKGKFITRVIYVEDPDKAIAEEQKPTDAQRYFEVRPGEDPLQAAKMLGRPVAVLRIGSLTPTGEKPSDAFLYGCPQLVPMTAAPAAKDGAPAREPGLPSSPVPVVPRQ